MTYVRVAVNVPAASGEFDYRLPPELEGRVGAGHLVSVPFGKQTVQGVVLELVAVPSVAETKPVLDLLDPLPVLTAAQIALARWMADYFLAPLAAMISLMLPAGLSQQADVLYALRGQPSAVSGQPSLVESRLLRLLEERGPLRGRQIDRHFARVDWRKTAQHLVRAGVLTARPVLPPPGVRPKFVRTAQLAVPPQEAEAALPTLGKTEATLARRQAALRFLMREVEPVNVSWVYAESSCTLADLQELAERGLIVLRETEIWRDPVGRIGDQEIGNQEIGNQEIGNQGVGNQEVGNQGTGNQGVKLTLDQESALKQILQVFRSSPPNSQSPNPELPNPQSPFLLHGVTGSGKTELYIRAAEEAVRRGKGALILVPEIALTPQTVRRFLARFPGQVGILHSRLSDGERYDTWRRARLGLLKVIIGPRSALFVPLPEIGLIVLDECHDSSYYQAEPPFYHAVTAARQYARLCGAVCILGSATPTIVQQYEAARGETLTRLELPERVAGRALPEVRVVDMRAELKSDNRSIFSRELSAALEDVLARGQQAILYLNRRGTATYVFCRECGYVAKCPNCETPLTLHVDRLAGSQGDRLKGSQVSKLEENLPTFQPSNLPTLICHRCNYHRRMPEKCPACGSAHIRAYGLGSEKVEAEVQARFPSARTLRWDWETTRQKDAHEIILSHFAAHRADVLVGTQMLAKGLDLPLVTLVGIVLADVGLNLPDPFAAERTFGLLTQVAGRAGRSALGGRVILQTFQPEHYVIQAAAQHDVAGFYARELEERRRLAYPPFARLVRLEYRHLDPVKAEAEVKRVVEKIARRLAGPDYQQTTLIGPAPCFFSRAEGFYRWQIVLRGPHPESLVREMRLDGWRVEVEPVSLL